MIINFYYNMELAKKFNLKNRLPLHITNETCELITELNYLKLGRKKSDIGKYHYIFPQEFIEGVTYPKVIRVENQGTYKADHTASFGDLVYADFNTMGTQMEHCIGFVTYHFTPTNWITKTPIKTSLIWFKDMDGVTLLHPRRFIIIGWLYF